jgi:hypothetical protein
VTWVDAADAGSEPPPTLERIAAQGEAGGRAIATRVARDGRTSTFLLMLDEPASPDARASGVGDYQTDARVLHHTERQDGSFVLDLVDATHARTQHDRGISIAARAPVTDLHLALEVDILDVRSSTPSTELRVEGAPLRRVSVVRVNGRDRAPGVDGNGAIVIGGAEWGATPGSAVPSVPATAAL